METAVPRDRWLMPENDLARLIELLVAEFDVVLGPVVDRRVVRMRPVRSIDDLPQGFTDEQEAGTYRLTETGGAEHFSYALGPDSLKSIVHPPDVPVWTMRRRDGSIIAESTSPTARSTAVIGVRACDIRALGVLARTRVAGEHADDRFAARHRALFLIATDCTHPAATCFCSTTDGPTSDGGFDLALTELSVAQPAGVEYLVRVGTERGREIVDRLSLDVAPAAAEERAGAAMRRADRALVRELPGEAREIVDQPDHPQWQAVADRCLMCGNCTAVCPTCFCTDMDDRIGLDGETAERRQVWDTCFSQEYSHLGPGPHRASPRSRYRQWLTHKLGTWHDQFGESGCVGCGRCIAWCPVGIDLTAEVESLARRPVGRS